MLFAGLMFGIIGLSVPWTLHGQTDQHTQGSHSMEALKDLRSIRTLLIGGKVTTWLDLEYPPYDPVSTLKIKLEEAGFQVVFDPKEAHDAIFVIEYTESPSGTFRLLEQGTSVRFTTTVYHPRMGAIYENEFEATPDEVAVEGLYWGTIGKLEENPWYYYQGFILKAWLHNQTNAGSVLIHMLRRVYTDTRYATPDERPGKAYVRRMARYNAIREIGKLKDPRALETLWELTQMATPEERKIAVDVLGNIGDASFIPKLSQLAETYQDSNVQLAVQAAIHTIETRR